MRSYLKSFVKDVYDNMITDDYLQKISQAQVYKIVNTFHRKLSEQQQQNNRSRRLSIGALPAQSSDLINNYSFTNPQRQLKILGYEPSIQSINLRMRTLREHLEDVTIIMTENYPKYRHMIEKSLNEIDNIKGMQSARIKSIELRKRLKRLQQATLKSKKITELNIKAKNIKSVINIAKQIPNISKMTLIQLKGIKQRKIKHNEKLKNLDCLEGISSYIDRFVGEQLAGVIKILQECLIHNFNSQLYQNALKNFIITQHQKIKYERMLVRLVQKQIRRYSSQMGTEMFQICEFYTKIIINLHSVFRWHRQNEQEQTQRIRKLSKQYEDDSSTSQHKQNNQNAISISINISSVTKMIAESIDDCLKTTIIQKMHNPQNPQIYLQTIYLVLRMSEMVEKFSGKKLETCFNEIKNQYIKINKQIKDKAYHDLLQALDFQDKNEWNRFPVPSDYSHTVIDKKMYQIWRVKKSAEYEKVMKIIRKSSNKNSQYQQQQEQSWEIEPVLFQQYEKFEKYHKQIKINSKDQVIICQSSLTILKFIQKIIELYFYFPIENTIIYAQQQKIPVPVQNCIDLFEFYLFYIFHSLVSNQLKTMYYKKQYEMETIQAKYHKKRFNYQYSLLIEFLGSFPQKNDDRIVKNLRNLGKDRQKAQFTTTNNLQINQGQKSGLMKCRVVACQSSSYILAYIKHMFTVCDDPYHHTAHKQTIQTQLLNLDKLADQLIDLVYTDMVPKIISFSKIINLIESIKWTDDIQDNIRQYAQILVKTFKDFYFRMKAVNKGIIPVNICDRIFGFYWKTQLTVIVKAFIKIFNPKKFSSSPVLKLQFFIDCIYQQILQLFPKTSANHKYQTVIKSNRQFIDKPYLKVKQIFQICLETDWHKLSEHIEKFIQRYEYVYGISLGILMISEYGVKLDEESRKERQKQVNIIIMNNIEYKK